MKAIRIGRHLVVALCWLVAIGASAQVKLVGDVRGAHLEVKGKPFMLLGGELSNSAATSVADIDKVMPRMAALGLNTVLVPVYWELLEPTEGSFDFTLVDRILLRAREHRLHVVLLWFGAWKNSMSCYAPLWFKEDTRRFPRAMTAEGKPLEIASCFSENVLQADLRAFTRLMEHLSTVDKDSNTVLMVQIENEIGMLEAARDHSPLAERAFDEPIPRNLLPLLRMGQEGQGSEFKVESSKFKGQGSRFKGQGSRFKGQGLSWRDVASDDSYWDEQFQAWHYACYVEQLAQAARRIHNVPLYVNAAMNSRGRRPGEYPSAGPLAHLADIWKLAAPSVDLLAPDIYDTGFKSWAAQYDLPGNPLFIPESRCCRNSGVRALYAFGEHHAVGFSPFAIDQASDADARQVTEAYRLLNQLQSVAAEKTWGVLFTQDDQERVFTDEASGGVVVTCRHAFTLPWDPRATDGSEWPEGGGFIMRLGPLEYLIAGNGIVVEFSTNYEHQHRQQTALGEDGFAQGGAGQSEADTSRQTLNAAKWGGKSAKRLGIGYADEVEVDPGSGQLVFLRRDNGDQTHQGRHVRISVGDYRLLHVKLYEYSPSRK